MTRILGALLLLIGSSTIVSASAVPEIDVNSGASALALLTGGLLILRARRKR